MCDPNEEDRGIYAVIPAYNEEGTIEEVVSAVRLFTRNVVVVDDGSTDQTAKLAQELGAYTIIHPVNMGYDRSIEDGFRYVERQEDVYMVFTFDADGQHKAEVLKNVIQPILINEADIVVGIRPYKARVAEKLLALYTNHKYGILDPLCGLKGYKIDVFRNIGFFDRINSIGTELLLRAKQKGYRVKQVPIPIEKRYDRSRFGQAVRGNCKIFMAFLKILFYI